MMRHQKDVLTILAWVVLGAVLGTSWLFLLTGVGMVLAVLVSGVVLLGFPVTGLIKLIGSVRGRVLAPQMREHQVAQAVSQRNTLDWWQWSLMLLPGTALVLVILIEDTLAGVDLPATSLIAGTALFYTATILTVMTHRGVLGISAQSEEVRRELELLESAPVQLHPAMVKAVAAYGVCPYGYQVGNTWTIDRDGHISPGLCRAAVTPLTEQLHGRVTEEQMRQVVSCQCSLGSRHITFAIYPSPQESEVAVAR